MRIGLLRHFPVEEAFPWGWPTSAELQAWRGRYEMAKTVVGEFDLGGIAWRQCICSDLPRACVTARAVFQGEVKHTALLREAEFTQFKTGSLRLPVLAWRLLLRLSWMIKHPSQRDCCTDFRRRGMEMVDRLSALDQDTLVVSHAGMMSYLSAELRRRGFAGPKLRIAKHATVYIYEKR